MTETMNNLGTTVIFRPRNVKGQLIKGPQKFAVCHPDRPHKALGLCRACYSKQNGGTRKWYQKHKKLTKLRAKLWAKQNPERRKEIVRKSAKKAYYKNPKKFIDKHASQLKNNLNFRIAHYLRSRIRMALRGYDKAESTIKLLGCSVEKLRIYLESHFKEGMTWDNYGINGWHIDHKKPCSQFNLKNLREQKRCFHYTNLQPLWAFENRSKGGRR